MFAEYYTFSPNGMKTAIIELHAMPINEMQLLLNLLPCYWCIGNVW